MFVCDSRRNGDGIHWDSEANRLVTNLILTHLTLMRKGPVALPGRATVGIPPELQPIPARSQFELHIVLKSISIFAAPQNCYFCSIIRKSWKDLHLCYPGKKTKLLQLNLTIFCVFILKSRKTPLQCQCTIKNNQTHFIYLSETGRDIANILTDLTS